MCFINILNNYCTCLFIGVILLLLGAALYTGNDYNVVDKNIEKKLSLVFLCFGSLLVLSYIFSCLCSKKKYKKIRRHSSFDNYDNFP